MAALRASGEARNAATSSWPMARDARSRPPWANHAANARDVAAVLPDRVRGSAVGFELDEEPIEGALDFHLEVSL